jgi:hypothetical protein
VSRVARLAPRTAWRASAWYAVATIVMTWPLAPQLMHGVPSDFGDPLLNCWILAWNADHFLKALTGDVGALRGLWHTNIFFPEPYTLAYSELLIAQSLQILPIYAVTGNIVLCYNLLFLSTFFLSAVGMFLLVRAMVGDWRVAFVAGLMFGFLPYRSAQASHLQVMSTQWMPLALLGFHRAVATLRLRPLAGGTLALVTQSLSCGYFLVFFSLFVPPFVVFEMFRHGRLRRVQLWVALAVAAVVAGAVTLPFMQPYFALRDLRGTKRHIDELKVFSADTWSWMTAEYGTTPVSRWVRLAPRPEGSLFPGVLTSIFAVMGVVGGVRRTWTASRRVPFWTVHPPHAAGRWWRRPRVWTTVGLVLAGAGGLTLLLLIAGAGGIYMVGDTRIRVQSIRRPLALACVGAMLLLATSPRIRAAASRAVRSPLAFAAVSTFVAVYLSLGPDPRAGGTGLGGPAVYAWLFETVPGFDGLRVPARFAAVALLFMVLVAGWGLRDVLARWPRRAALTAALVSAGWLAEATVVPLPVNAGMSKDSPELNAPPSHVPVWPDVPPIIAAVRQLPDATVLLVLPIGDISWEIRHVYDSTMHWRRMVNGYSGYAPDSYLDLANLLREPYRAPKAAWNAVLAAGITHILVRGGAYSTDEPPSPLKWLEAHGAVPIATRGIDRLYRVPR